MCQREEIYVSKTGQCEKKCKANEKYNSNTKNCDRKCDENQKFDTVILQLYHA